MRKTLFALTALSALAALSTTPADARGGRAVCLHGAQTYGVYDCSYDSIAQCNATLSGTYGSCDVNPEYIARGYNPQNAYDQQYSSTPPRRRARYYNGY
jgi:Protein of unknown function (DUF3551)